MFTHPALSDTIAQALFASTRTYANRVHCAEYTKKVSSASLMLATVAVRHALGTYTGGIHQKAPFDGHIYKGKEISLYSLNVSFEYTTCVCIFAYYHHSDNIPWYVPWYVLWQYALTMHSDNTLWQCTLTMHSNNALWQYALTMHSDNALWQSVLTISMRSDNSRD
jgi:hypothetical protein